MFTLREAQRGRCVSGRWERARAFGGRREGVSEEALGGGGRRGVVSEGE